MELAMEREYFVRFMLFEPLLGPIYDLDLDGIDWVIVGGDLARQAAGPGTGRRRRPQNPRSPRPAQVRLGRGARPERARKAPGLTRPSVAPARHPARKRVQGSKRGGEGAR